MWSEAVGRELAQVAAFNPLPGQSPPEELPAFQAVHWEVGAMGVDLRPHVFDPGLNRWLLCNSGSQISAIPPDPGDVEDKNTFLKAVNGTKSNVTVLKNWKSKSVEKDIDSPSSRLMSAIQY